MLNESQFDHERVARAMAIPVEERRTRMFSERKQAAKSSATHWAIAVNHSDHDSLKEGKTEVSETHVLLSKDEFPDPMHAEQVAYLLGRARGTYPTRVRHV
jgi:hypothetical protein